MGYPTDDTIAAIATPFGEGAIAIVRLSGKDSLSIVEKIFSGPLGNYKSHTAHYGQVINMKKTVIDSSLVLVMRSPHSYTGEDSVEIHCHGGSFITRKVLETVLEAGARSAYPGEFTYRAYRNGKLDLAQAEAVCQLIGAKNELALQAAEDHLSGRFSKKIHAIQDSLLSISAELEAQMDYPDEDLETHTAKDLLFRLEGTLLSMETLIKTYDEGKVFSEGISICIVGAPNVGKSSLFNALCHKDRAIVTPIAGTTRDLVEETVKLGQMTYHLIDTAGMRKTEDLVEKEGIDRAKEAFKKADLIIHLLDASRLFSSEDRELFEILPEEKTLRVWNKTDLCKPKEKLPALEISAKEQKELFSLFTEIEKRVMKKEFIEKGEIVLTKLRHKEALEAAVSYLEKAKRGIDENVSLEFIADDIRFGLVELGKILGSNVTEEILSSIFSKFCVGK